MLKAENSLAYQIRKENFAYFALKMKKYVKLTRTYESIERMEYSSRI